MSNYTWDQIKQLRVVPRMVHLACEAGMMVNPLNPMGPRIPWVQRPGKTLDLGRNKAKREARAAAKLRLGNLQPVLKFVTVGGVRRPAEAA